jgi:hypothetical protein
LIYEESVFKFKKIYLKGIIGNLVMNGNEFKCRVLEASAAAGGPPSVFSFMHEAPAGKRKERRGLQRSPMLVGWLV